MHAILPVLGLKNGIHNLIEHSGKHCVIMTPLIYLLNSLCTDQAKYIDLLIFTSTNSMINSNYNNYYYST